MDKIIETGEPKTIIQKMPDGTEYTSKDTDDGGVEITFHDPPVLLGTDFATVVSADLLRIDFIMVELYKHEDGEIVYTPMFYVLNEGESIILDDWQKANELAMYWTIVRYDEENKEWVGEGDPIEQPEPPPPSPEPGKQFTEDEATFLKDFIIGYSEESEGAVDE